MATAAAAVESHWITVAQRAPGSTERERERKKERKKGTTAGSEHSCKWSRRNENRHLDFITKYQPLQRLGGIKRTIICGKANFKPNVLCVQPYILQLLRR